jgi:hypothetical protein
MFGLRNYNYSTAQKHYKTFAGSASREGALLRFAPSEIQSGILSPRRQPAAQVRNLIVIVPPCPVGNFCFIIADTWDYFPVARFFFLNGF